MDNMDINRYILDRLSQAHELNDIILGSCEIYGTSWQDAETLVLKLQLENSEEIAVRQAPLMTVLALVSFIAGIVLITIGVYPFIMGGIALIQEEGIQNISLSSEFFISMNMLTYLGLNPHHRNPAGYRPGARQPAWDAGCLGRAAPRIKNQAQVILSRGKRNTANQSASGQQAGS